MNKWWMQRKTHSVPTDWASWDVLHTDFSFILLFITIFTSWQPLATPTLPHPLSPSPFFPTALSLLPILRHRSQSPHHTSLCTDQIASLCPVIRFTLIFMKKGEDEEDEAGEPVMAWGCKKTIEQRWKRRRWKKREARGRGDEKEESDEKQLKSSWRVTRRRKTISWTDFEKRWA